MHLKCPDKVYRSNPKTKLRFAMFLIRKKNSQKGSFFGQGWIRTTVLSREQIYSLSPLATRPPTLIQFSLFFILPLTRFELVASPLPRECATPAPQRQGFFFCLIFNLRTFDNTKGALLPSPLKPYSMVCADPCHRGKAFSFV